MFLKNFKYVAFNLTLTDLMESNGEEFYLPGSPKTPVMTTFLDNTASNRQHSPLHDPEC